MPKTLIIAEKPSVANDLARVLGQNPDIGKFESKKDFHENSSYLISSAVGHLVEQTLPMGPDGKPLPWKFDSLPVIPDEFDLQAIPGNKGRFSLLVRLMKRKDVAEIINACDAGREGELIFRYIMKLSGVDKPTRRLWMQSMTNSAINEAFAHLRSDEEMRPLASAALCRSESDWLVGINSTRAMTAYNSRFGGFNKTPVGRVQTPTLALLAEREQEIADFVAEPYFEVHAEFGVRAGEYLGRWFDEKFRKSEDKPHARPERIWDAEQAAAIVERCRNREAEVEEKKKPSKQATPMLYDLTSLQREANGRYGLSARRTLQLAQSLYERHKALTYPRTDSRFLPEDYVATTRRTLEKIAGQQGGIVTNLPGFAGEVLAEDWIRPGNKRIFNSAKVSDHFAIIPTGQFPGRLDEYEQRIYDMVARRFVAAFYPSAEFEVTTRISRIEKDAFKSDGKILIKPGWLAVYGKDKRSDDSARDSGTGEKLPLRERIGKNNNKGKDKTLVPVADGERARVEEIEQIEKETRPPPRYNESTLLSAMETAGKRVDDEELRSAMSERGLGTPATRATIIEGLLQDKYLSREGRDLYVSTRGMRLVEQIRDMGIDILASPEMTGEWEYKLKQMEQGRLQRPAFMEEIRTLTREVVDTAKEAAEASVNREYPDLPVPCPVCGAPELGQEEIRYRCKQPDCKFTLNKVVATRPFSDAEVEELLRKKFVGPLTGFVSRFKKPFDAAVELVEDKKAGLKAAFRFEKSDDEEEEEESVRAGGNVLTKCPVCEKGQIHVTPHSYVCDQRVLGDGCKGRLSRTMCKVEIPPEQARKFFDEGRTDQIDTFISKKGRPFSARLVCNPKGKRILNWEFPPRAPKKKAAKKKTADN